jgi:hypothetical protein
MTQKISYVLVGSLLVEDYMEGDYMTAVKAIDNGDGVLIVYDHDEPLSTLLEQIDGWGNPIEITKEEAEAIKSHLND